MAALAVASRPMRFLLVILAIALIAAPGSLAQGADPGLFGYFRSICAAGDLNVLTVSPIGGVTFLMLSRTRVAT